MRFPIPPMEADALPQIPTGERWLFEPKWDGFRCLVFKHRNKVRLQSKAQKELTKYFPEIVALFRAVSEERFVLDGELVIPRGKALSFDDLLMRIHPASSRIERLSKESPASYIAFDILSLGGRSLMQAPMTERRLTLERFMKEISFDPNAFDTLAEKLPSKLLLSPVAKSPKEALQWVKKSGVSLDGVMAKEKDSPYRSGERAGIAKIKFKRTADCVIGGYRLGTKDRLVSTLLLGLYDAKGKLNHVGHCTVNHLEGRSALTKKLKRLEGAPGFTGSAPGGPSRWANARSEEWAPLKTSLVVEVEFDHFSGGRFRHGTRFLRWRADKTPRSCSVKQVLKEQGAALMLAKRIN